MTRYTRSFRPTALNRAQLDDLLRAVHASQLGDPLTLAKALRTLADTCQGTRQIEHEAHPLVLAVASSVLADLIEQGWEVTSDGYEIYVTPPDIGPTSSDSVDRVKARIRNALMMSSDRQLATSATREFIQMMERQRSFNGRVVSVYDLVDDGSSLAEKLRPLTKIALADRTTALLKVIRPVVQVCDSDSRCEFTGHKLLDVWRYFRHTWALEYNPVPGRTLRLLVRNKARPNWPVMGIAMLSSPAANLYSRDSWIGWRTEDLITNLLAGRWDASYVAKRLLSVIRQSIDEIRSDDLATPEELEAGGKAVLFRLSQIGARSTADRRNDLQSEICGTGDSDRLIDIRSLDLETSDLNDEHWRKLSETALYRMKRAEQLIPLVETLQYFKSAGMETAPAASLYEILSTKRGGDAVSFALNEIRKRGLASDVADLSVCGAIAPYNHLLAGKLTALLAASQEVREFYLSRYKGKASEIASQIAGKAMVRPSDLKVITTTSLYGVGSSQYNRLRLRAGVTPQLFNDLSWDELDMTQGYSVTHFSKRTVGLMRDLGIAVHGRRKINSVFGEGSSPRTRQIRQGLLLIGIAHDAIMKQPSGRRVYACEIYPGAKEDLVGLVRPSRRGKAARADVISRAWAERWVSSRIAQPNVLERVASEDQGTVARELRVRILRGSTTTPPDASDKALVENAMRLSTEGAKSVH